MIDDSVQVYDAISGEHLQLLVKPGIGGLLGARGIIVDKQGGPHANLLTVSQNPLVSFSGTVLIFDRDSGQALGQIMPITDTPGIDAPWAPQGVLLASSTLYVADTGAPAPLNIPSFIHKYNRKTGAHIASFRPTSDEFPKPFLPRGIVLGPDGLLYATSSYSSTGPGGAILRFDPDGTFLDVVYDCPDIDINCHLHRPDGLVFGPDDLLYVTSFRRIAGDYDRLLIFDVEDSEQPKAEIALGTATERAFAQAILFGPGGYLYVPISGNSEAHTGTVRRYDVSDITQPSYEVIIPKAGEPKTLVNPRYFTFGRTNPATLEYDETGCG